jgi:riboflavin biosynthesis pyrimidine reductase
MRDRRMAFTAFAEHKQRQASAATIRFLTTVFDDSDDADTLAIGNAWTRSHYGGDFALTAVPPTRTAVSLTFVQSRDRNTGGPDPAALGGGDTDQHLLYEGLSRVAADAVLAGAGTLHATAFFSVWHPELVALRLSLGLPRHPAQIVVSKHGRFDFASLLFNVPDVPVVLIAGEQVLVRHAAAISERPWVEPILLNGGGLTKAIDRLRLERRIHRISAVGGRSTATRLVDEGLAQDIYLTTGAREGGETGTPWYVGTASLALSVMTRKEWIDGDSRPVFEHIRIQSMASR